MDALNHEAPIGAGMPGWSQLLSAARGTARLPEPAPAALSMYLPLLTVPAHRPLVFAHLAQSLDGRIALDAGASQWLSGPADLDHTHRLRALADAVLVGASTVALDNPRLTVRRVPGRNPLRLVIDPMLRLSPDHTVFQSDAAPTLVICRADAPGDAPAEVLRLPVRDGALCPRDICAALWARGVRRLMIEGGGVTVSRFLSAGRLDRLHLVVAPVVLGQGRPSLRLEAITSLDEATRPKVTRHALGVDTLFDCDFRGVRG